MSFDFVKVTPVALPPPSILEKIKQYDPEGPEEIMDLAALIADSRRQREDEELRLKYSFHKSVTSRSFWQGFFSIFANIGMLMSGKPRFIAPEIKPEPVAPAQNPFIHVGNDMRDAIVRYLAVHEDIKDKIKLTPAEEAGLRRIPVSAIERAQRGAPQP